MTKRSLTIILVCIILTVIALKFIGYHHKEDKGFVGFFGRLLNKTNSFSVTFAGVNKMDFDIIWQTEDGFIDTLVKNGNTKSNFGYEYGPEKFIIIYKGVTLCSDGFFSQNNNDTHDVQINISNTEEEFLITYLIDKRKTTTRITNNSR